MKVALDARLYTRTMTGDTSYWRGLVSGLLRLDSNVEFLLYSNSPRPSEIPDSPRIRWIELNGHDRWWSLVQFPLHARRSGARVLHTQYNLSPLAGRHSVTTIHDVSFLIGPQWFSAKDRILLSWQIPSSVRRAARVITVSETSRLDIEKHIPSSRGKVAVTYNALGDNIRPQTQQQALSIVSSLGVTGRYLFSVGTRWPRKNLNLAIRAAQLAGEQIVVTGKAGWGVENTDAFYTGYVSDEQLTALYQCASLYLAPSYHEGFGIPLLEAFACGCPVLCSPGGALPEVSGGAAEVTAGFGEQEWAERIRSLLSDSSKLVSMRERGLQRVKEFDWLSTAERTLAVYREAAQ